MPLRIYAFAKELGLDNKKLLEICEKVGIKNKGSALASLEDDEVDKVKKYLSDGGADSSAKSKRPAIERPSSQPQAAQPAMNVAAPVAPDLSRKSGLRDLGSRPKRENVLEKTQRPPSAKPPIKKPEVNVKLAAMPDVKPPPAVTPPPKERVMKPDMALPKQAIREAMIRGSRQAKDEKAGKDGGKPDSGNRSTSTKPSEKGPQKPVFDPAALQALAESPLSGRRKAKKSKDEKDESVTDTSLGATRQERRSSRVKQVSLDGEERLGYRGRATRRPRNKKNVANTSAPRKELVTLEMPCTVRTFSEGVGVGKADVLRVLLTMGVMANINSELNMETAQFVAAELGLQVNFKEQETLEESMLAQFDAAEQESTDDGALRPPIVTFLGHVDHGKTSLLDAIIGIDVVSGEAGGITQHIRAYQVDSNGQKISFVDTPGHEAFTEMRARGANVTDIAVLVVAADDGIMPQTEEAISHAKAAGVPIIVAMNKIDLPSANPDKVLQELAAHNLIPSEWGGDIEVIRTSATKGTGIQELLETILVTAELHEYKANPDRPAHGTCLEAEQESSRGVIAKFLVQSGTLRLGDIVVCGTAHGRVKAMYDTLRPNVQLEVAGPSTPVNLAGLDVAPNAGDKFHVLPDIIQAREIAAARAIRGRTQSLSGVSKRISLEDFQSRLEAGNLVDDRDIVELNLIIRADVRGSIEAIQKELSKIDHPEVKVKILQALVGGITVADVRLAQASQAVIIGFNVVPDEVARSLAEEVQVEIRRYSVIYKITDDVRATLEGKLKPEMQSVNLGMAMVLRTFNISRIGTIAGCRVMRGTIERGSRIRLIRDNRVIGEYDLDTLKREKDDAKEVQRGMECGIKLAGFDDIKEGDTLEAYKIEEVSRTL
ncbi:MAG TPA: translation initiation factor IF-2 [Pirellulaceae bacterium]|nr:translation initiation factor IF-2 [Pirellulaceae bacterium]HMO92162.1 translation initiation factor IF-2 [Pirellulaceae bacterium]HMP68912.1 translation initiation factor IF-2 [Pirellulaceae bacterium]